MSDEQHADADGQEAATDDSRGAATADEQSVPPELVAAVEDNPEEVARLVQNAGQVNDLLDASAVATAAIDDGMVQRLAADGSNLGAAADGAATPELAQLGESVGNNADSLAEGVETVVELQESGTLDDLAAFADTIALLSAAMDDEMVTSLTSMGSRLGELADTASDDEVAQGLGRCCTPSATRRARIQNQSVPSGWSRRFATPRSGPVWASQSRCCERSDRERRSATRLTDDRPAVGRRFHNDFISSWCNHGPNVGRVGTERPTMERSASRRRLST